MNVGVLTIHGLPAMHGAFEQTVDRLANTIHEKSNLKLYVGCEKKFKKYDYSNSNVIRVFLPKPNFKFGVLLFGLMTFTKLYLLGIRRFLVFGYSLAPFFWLFEVSGCKIICNVDGFEWRRSKWGKLAKFYFRFCEKMAARSNALLIYDSYVIERYYSIIHKRKGEVIFYGSDNFQTQLSFNADYHYDCVVMRMEPENNIFIIVKAYADSISSKKLYVIGPSTNYFEKNVMPLINSDSRIIYLGPIYDRLELYRYRSFARFYIHGHSVGGTNPTLVEACQIGRPIIAYDTLFNREVLGENGKYFSDSKGLTSIINEIENDISKQIDPPTLGVEYQWNYISNQYLKLIRE